MPKWFDMTDSEILRELNRPFPGPSIMPEENDPLTDAERDLGLRLFRKVPGKVHTKDIKGGTIGSGESAGEAIDDLRRKVTTS
jgi:hypothetical protein